jgi:hypothetical protein
MCIDVVIIIILGLFNNIFSCVGYTVFNVRTISESRIGKDVGGSGRCICLVELLKCMRNFEKPKSGWPAPGPSFEPGTS